MKSGLLRNWQARLTRSNEMRARTSAYFSASLLLRLPSGASHPYLRLPILLPTRKDKARLHALSQARGLGLSSAYPTPVNEIPQIRAAFNGTAFPSARNVAECLLTIPTHHWLSDEDKQVIADCVRATTGAGRRPAQRRQAS